MCCNDAKSIVRVFNCKNDLGSLWQLLYSRNALHFSMCMSAVFCLDNMLHGSNLKEANQMN